MELIIELNTIGRVKDFSTKAFLQPFNMELCDNTYTVNAKSILGIFSLDLSGFITLVIHDDGYESECDAFLESIKNYIVGD